MAKEIKKKESPLSSLVSAPNARVETRELNVMDEKGNFARKYTLELHGKDFVEKAKGYAQKIKGRTESIILT